MAKYLIEQRGQKLGVTATTFAPDKAVSAAEAIAMLMKFLGVKEDSRQAWPANFIDGARDAGLITEHDRATLMVAPLSPAIRGLVFYLADQAFYNYRLAESRKSVYQTYLDPTPPVVTVNDYPATTGAARVTLTGTVSGQRRLSVGTGGGNRAEVGPDGTWSAIIDLALGLNTIWVEALDYAGNIGRPPGAVQILRVQGE